jgi:hypothetical protein
VILFRSAGGSRLLLCRHGCDATESVEGQRGRLLTPSWGRFGGWEMVPGREQLTDVEIRCGRWSAPRGRALGDRLQLIPLHDQAMS